MDLHNRLRQEEQSMSRKEFFSKRVIFHEQTNRDGKIYFMRTNSEESGKQDSGRKDRTRHVLIVEDDRVSILYIKELINMLDIPGISIQVHQVFTGERAIEYIRNEPCHLVLMDLKLPGIDGLVATREIKRFRPFLPVIAQTAFALSGDQQKALEAGCDDYIAKPISEKDLTDIIKKFLAAS